MKKLLFGLCLLFISLVSVSFADFQSELDLCAQKNQTANGLSAYTLEFDKCISKVTKKYTLTKSSACKLSDGLYDYNDYLLKLSWPKREANSRQFYKYSKVMYYVVHTTTSDGLSSDYLYSYNCKTKKTLDLGIYFKNSGEFGRVINIKAAKKDILLLEGYMVPRGPYSLFDSKEMNLYPIKPKDLKGFTDLKKEVKKNLLNYFQKKGLSIPKNFSSLEEYVEQQLTNLDRSPLSKQKYDLKNLLTIDGFDKNGLAFVYFNKGNNAFAADEDLSNINLGMIDFFNKTYIPY